MELENKLFSRRHKVATLAVCNYNIIIFRASTSTDFTRRRNDGGRQTASQENRSTRTASCRTRPATTATSLASRHSSSRIPPSPRTLTSSLAIRTAWTNIRLPGRESSTSGSCSLEATPCASLSPVVACPPPLEPVGALNSKSSTVWPSFQQPAEHPAADRK